MCCSRVPSDPDYGVLSTPRPRRDDRRRAGRGRALQARPCRLRAVEAERRRRDRLGFAVGPRPAGLAHRMLGDDRARISARRSTSTAAGSTSSSRTTRTRSRRAAARTAALPLARYWVHNGFVDMGAEKMSKSLGNIITPADLLAQGHQGETLRLALLSRALSPAAAVDGKPDRAGEGDARPAVSRGWRCRARAKSTTACSTRCRDDLNTPLALSRLSALDEPATLQGQRGAARAAAELGRRVVPGRRRRGGDRSAHRRARRSQEEPRLRRPPTASATSSRPRASSWRTGPAALHGAGNERARSTRPRSCGSRRRCRSRARSSGRTGAPSCARRPAAARSRSRCSSTTTAASKRFRSRCRPAHSARLRRRWSSSMPRPNARRGRRRAARRSAAGSPASSDDPGDWPGIAALAPARSRKSRHGAILLPFRALLAAMEAAR